MDAVEHVMMIEDGFGISIPDKDAADLWTVGAWDSYLCSRYGEFLSWLLAPTSPRRSNLTTGRSLTGNAREG